MLRFIVLLLIVTSAVAQDANTKDAALIKQVQEFAKDVNSKIPINRILESHSENQQQEKAPQLFVFISSSMPAKSIQQWAIQAEKLGAELVIRGFVNNSFKETVLLAQKLFSKHQVGGFNVDPFKFTQYQVEVVPTVVLDVGGVVDKVHGDIGLFEVLELIKAQGENKIDARNYLSKI